MIEYWMTWWNLNDLMEREWYIGDGTHELCLNDYCLNDSRVKYWMMNKILNDQDVSWGIGKGLALECATVLMGSDQKPRCAVELKETEWNLRDVEWYWLTMNDM